jgi:hypothetical protein
MIIPAQDRKETIGNLINTFEDRVNQFDLMTTMALLWNGGESTKVISRANKSTERYSELKYSFRARMRIYMDVTCTVDELIESFEEHMRSLMFVKNDLSRRYEITIADHAGFE